MCCVKAREYVLHLLMDDIHTVITWHSSMQCYWKWCMNIIHSRSLFLGAQTASSQITDVHTLMCHNSTVQHTLPWQCSLITISQDDHSFYPMFPTDHCRRVPIFRRKVRWRSNTYDGHLSFDVAFTCSRPTMTRCGVYDLMAWRFKCFSSNLVLR